MSIPAIGAVCTAKRTLNQEGPEGTIVIITEKRSRGWKIAKVDGTKIAGGWNMFVYNWIFHEALPYNRPAKLP